MYVMLCYVYDIIYIYIYSTWISKQKYIQAHPGPSLRRVLKADLRSPASWPSSGDLDTAKCPFFAISTIPTCLGRSWETNGWIFLYRHGYDVEISIDIIWTADGYFQKDMEFLCGNYEKIWTIFL